MSELFEVEKILAKREIKSKHPKNKKEYEYSIKWKGYNTPTWEPCNSLMYCPKLLDAFEKNKLIGKSPGISTKNSMQKSSKQSSTKSNEEPSMLSREKSSNKSMKTFSRKSTKKLPRESPGKTARKSHGQVPAPKKQKKKRKSLPTNSTEKKKSKTFLFQCAKCTNRSFKNHKLLGSHIKQFHPQRIVNGVSQRRARCGNCGASYIHAHMLSKHPCTSGKKYPTVSASFNWNSNTPPMDRPDMPMTSERPKCNILMTQDKITLYQDIFKCLGVDTEMLMRNSRSSETINLL